MRQGQKTSAEQVVLNLLQIEVHTAPGKNIAVACKEADILEQSYYRWRKEYGGLKLDQAERMKGLSAAIAALTAFLGGGVILSVLKDEVPSERQSRFWAFALGAAAYSALVLSL
nr:transposase [Methylobacterium sp. J-070]